MLSCKMLVGKQSTEGALNYAQDGAADADGCSREHRRVKYAQDGAADADGCSSERERFYDV